MLLTQYSTMACFEHEKCEVYCETFANFECFCKNVVVYIEEAHVSWTMIPDCVEKVVVRFHYTF